MEQRIFILDDEDAMLKVATDLLRGYGYQVSTETDPIEGLKRILETPPDLLLLDVRMPRMDGFEVCRRLRADPRTKDLQIVIISIQNEESDVVAGLEVGADDYITKPFRERELLARVKALFRRQKGAPEPKILEAGPLKLDLLTYTATAKGKNLDLTPKEFLLLALFIKREGLVTTRPTISELVWGTGHLPTSLTINTHVNTLRRKLGRYQSCIQALKGIGYRFEIED